MRSLFEEMLWTSGVQPMCTLAALSTPSCTCCIRDSSSAFFGTKGYVSHPEPFKELLTQGMVLAKTYKDPETGRYLKPRELDMTEGNPRINFNQELPSVGWEKMSKSKYNGVEPSAMISRYGADVTRLATLFMAPPEQDLERDEFAVAGQARWVERVRKLVLWQPSRQLRSSNPALARLTSARRPM